MAETQSRTQLKSKAKAVLTRGYYQPDLGTREVHVVCPDCRRRVRAYTNLRGRGAVAAEAVLVPALVDHWYEGECVK